MKKTVFIKSLKNTLLQINNNTLKDDTIYVFNSIKENFSLYNDDFESLRSVSLSLCDTGKSYPLEICKNTGFLIFYKSKKLIKNFKEKLYLSFKENDIESKFNYTLHQRRIFCESQPLCIKEIVKDNILYIYMYCTGQIEYRNNTKNTIECIIKVINEL